MPYYCKRQAERHRYPLLNRLRHLYFTQDQLGGKAAPTGWMCAQKRPIDGLRLVIEHYAKHSKETLPDYLLLIDDDTHFPQMDRFLFYLWIHHSPWQPSDTAGCMI